MATGQIKPTNGAGAPASHQSQANVSQAATAQAPERFAVGVEITPTELDRFAREHGLGKLIDHGITVDVGRWHRDSIVFRRADGGVHVGIKA